MQLFAGSSGVKNHACAKPQNVRLQHRNRQMKQIFFIIATISILLSSCKNEEKREFIKEKKRIFSEIYNDYQIKSEFFEINSISDTTLKTKNGTTIKLYANSLMNADSTSFTGTFKLEVKEAYKPIDFVLGNLMTISNKQKLTTGGMVYVHAEANEKKLSLKNGSEIGFFVPTDFLDEEMMIYTGSRDTNQVINWESPEPILNSKLRTLEQQYITITFEYHGKFDSNDKTLNNWLFEPNRKVGDKTKVDTVQVKVIEIAQDFASLRESENGLFIPDVISNKGQNGFVEDYNTSYIFSVKKLGWANIDKLFSDPKSEEVEMLATIDNQNEFGFVFTSLLLPEQNMYIPGYQKKDNSYGFTHNDAEKLVLPIGSKAFLLATSYKDDKPFFKIKSITIEKNMKLSFALDETTPSELKKILNEKL